MSCSRSTLLLRNLSDVFGENDPVRRRAAIDDIWNEDGVFYDPNGGIYRGRDEIDRIAGVVCSRTGHNKNGKVGCSTSQLRLNCCRCIPKT